ncbi:MAG TPA: mechanosensitive ion channel domain-containing protein, partial [Rhizomicrobium sp.]|nr:mechanosensitive ion channel domain-containing protein [Rhizomicrobium sp.]
MTNDASFTGRIPAYISNAASKLLLQLRQPALLEQFAIIIAAGLVALWCAPRINIAFKRLALRAQSRAWALAAARVAGSLALPVVWLAILWAALLIGTATGFSLDILRAAISLLIAWIVIRIVSQLVGNETWSRLVAVIAWSIAALSILNLLAPIQDQLQHSSVSFGKFQVSALTMVRALFVLAVLLWLTTVLSNFAERRISTAKSLTPSLRVLFIQLLKLVLPALAVVAALAVVGVDLTALAVFSGAIGIGLGLGLQQSVSNLVAGLTLLLGKSIKPGDVVAYNNTYGWVTSMGARFVALRTRDGIEYLIPNNYFVTNGVTNWT